MKRGGMRVIRGRDYPGFRFAPSELRWLLNDQLRLSLQTNAGLGLVIEWSIKATEIKVEKHSVIIHSVYIVPCQSGQTLPIFTKAAIDTV